jgi:hypothetical protein
LKALESSHAAHTHAAYIPFAVAANDEDSTAFVAVAWQFEKPAGGGGAAAKGTQSDRYVWCTLHVCDVWVGG